MTEPSPCTSPMLRALELAECSIGLSDPNPRVGCVIIGTDGTLLGEGYTQAAGGPHAEIVALRDAAARGHDVAGATVFVTLEPCSHHGRTPPCCDALLGARVGRVVVACEDPNPLVGGQGIARLRSEGIGVEMSEETIAAAARELNIGFFSRMTRGLPWVRMKIAASLDGITALPDGQSQWITGEEARRDGHAWRKRAGAVLTGIGTVLADDPRLDVRLVPTQRQPLRVVVDSQARVPPGARILAQPGDAWVVTATEGTGRRWPDNVTSVALPDGHGRVDLPALLRCLGTEGVNELHVEAGTTLNGVLLEAGLVDELLVYMAATLLGPGRGMAQLAPLSGLEQANRWRFTDVRIVGNDARLVARRMSA